MTKIGQLVLGMLIVGLLGRAPVLAATCGNGILEAGEDCDDGNVLDGDCCSSTCHFESAGSPCTDDGEPCTADQCDGAGACTHDEPYACLAASSGQLTITKATSSANDKFVLKLAKAPPTAKSDFGDPTTTDGYEACVFGPDGLLMHVQAAPGGTCDGQPCWVATKKGYKFSDKSGANDGLKAIRLTGSTRPKTTLSMLGKGSNLPMPALPLSVPVMAQVLNVNTGQCFETYFFDLNKIGENSSQKFRAKASAPIGGAFGLQPLARQLDPNTTAAAEPAAPAPPATSPNPQEVYVRSISYGGSGCPQNSVGQSFSNDRTSFTLIFDEFIASSGPGVPVTEAQKNCQLNLNLHIPQGWSFSIPSFDYRGYVQLPAGITATQQSTYYFQGEVSQASAGTTFKGPISKDYLAHDAMQLSPVVWSSCNAVRPVNINTQIRINNPSSTQSAQITTDSIDGKIRFVLGLQWKHC